MPRHPIHGRFCENPNCGRAIDPMRPKGTRYCDSSCRGEASRVRAEAEVIAKAKGAKRSRQKPRKRAQAKPRKEPKPRARTPYCVMRKELHMHDGERALIGGFVIVGFAADTRRQRAVRVIAQYRDDSTEQYVAVPISALTLYDAEGNPVAQDGPEWEVELED